MTIEVVARSTKWTRFVPRTGIDFAIIIAAYGAIVTSLFHLNYAVTTWRGDELMMANVAMHRAALPVSQVIQLSLSDSGEIYSPALLIPLTLLAKIIGNDSSVIKLAFSVLILANALMLYIIMRSIRISATVALLCALIFLTAPTMIDAYTWMVSGQHLVTVLFSLSFVLAAIFLLRELEPAATIGVFIVASIVSFVGGAAREPFAATLAGTFIVSLAASLNWRRALLVGGSALFAVPELLNTIIWSRSGHQIKDVYSDFIGLNSHPWIFLTNLDPVNPFVYVSIAVLDVALLAWAIQSHPRNNPLVPESIIKFTSLGALGLTALFGSFHFGLVMVSLIPEGVIFHLDHTWISVTTPRFLPEIGLIVVGFAMTHRGLPAPIAAAVALTCLFTALYLIKIDVSTEAEGLMGHLQSFIFARYSIYFLPTILVTLGGLAQYYALSARHKLTIFIFLLVIAGNTAQLILLSSRLPISAPDEYSPVAVDARPCDRTEAALDSQMKGYGEIFKAAKLDPLTPTLIQRDATNLRWISAHPRDRRVRTWRECVNTENEN